MTNASELLEGTPGGAIAEIIDHAGRQGDFAYTARKAVEASLAGLFAQVTQLEAQLVEMREAVSLASRTLKIITGELEQAGGGRSATADDVIGICDALLTQSKEPKA